MTIERTRQIQGAEVPTFLYGTAWKEDRTRELVLEALRAGFRGIDTANQRKHYHEAQVGEALGQALEEGLITREEIFVQTKYTFQAGQDHRLPYDPEASIREQVHQSLASSQEHLGLEHIDALVLHGPSQRDGLGEADHQAWRAMEELQRAGKVGLLGVSNVSAGQLEALCELAQISPTFVQNRCFARTGWGARVRRVCAEHEVVYQGFSLLTANGRELSREPVREMATRHEATIPQLVFRFALQMGMIPLTGTTNPEHMVQDLAVYEGPELSEDELEILAQAGA